MPTLMKVKHGSGGDLMYVFVTNRITNILVRKLIQIISMLNIIKTRLNKLEIEQIHENDVQVLRKCRADGRT